MSAETNKIKSNMWETRRNRKEEKSRTKEKHEKEGIIIEQCRLTSSGRFSGAFG